MTAGRRRVRVAVVGDALLDVDVEGHADRLCPDAPAPVVEASAEHRRGGGAALAAALAGTRAEVVLVCALGRDGAGDEVRTWLAAAGVEVVDLGLDAPTPEKVRVRAGGQTVARLDRACTPVVPPGAWTATAAEAVAAADAVLVSDYGRGVAAALPWTPADLAVPVVWDPHTRGPRPPAGVDLLVPNAAEAAALLGLPAPAAGPALGVPAAVALAERLLAAIRSPVGMTAGALGAVLADGDAPARLVPAVPAAGDPCGAGDRYAATVTAVRASGGTRLDAIAAGVADARAWVAGGAGPVPLAAGATAAEVRARGGTVVAAGGCFDLLHAGHVELLEAAGRLGDHLVVLVNGDASIRRLKGPGRPLNAAGDRVRVLRSLGCVDDVVVFDEDTPCRALEVVRPHLFVKGADYAGAELPEERVLAAWGGRVVLLPVVAGRSTTRLIDLARRRATA